MNLSLQSVAPSFKPTSLASSKGLVSLLTSSRRMLNGKELFNRGTVVDLIIYLKNCKVYFSRSVKGIIGDISMGGLRLGVISDKESITHCDV